MPRILKPGPRPYVGVGIVLAGVALIATLPVLAVGRPWQAFQLAGAVLFLYGLICLLLSRQRVLVESDSIAFQELFKPTNRVLFRDISRSVPMVLGEPEHPLGLDVYSHSGRRPVLRLRLKSFRRSDITWLLSIPDLKVQK